MENILVADIMTREPVSIKKDANLLEVAKKLIKKKLGSLLIIEKKKLLGFISQKDVLWAIVKKSKEDLKSIKAISISPKKIITIKPSATIREAMSKMKKYKFDRIPVIKEGEVVGIITAKDIFNFNPNIFPELEEFAKIKEETKKLKRVKEKIPLREGICSECENHDTLYRIDGVMVCTSCINN